MSRGCGKGEPGRRVASDTGAIRQPDESAGPPQLPEDSTISSPPFSCLAIETATELPSVALLCAGELTVREQRDVRAPSRLVFEWVRELLGESAIGFDQLDCIAFGAGPGSFTGVRVAVALAQSLGYARGLPLCPVSTLAALAAGAMDDAGVDAVACCLDARLGEVYFGVYARDTDRGVRELSADAVLKPEAVSLPGRGTFLAAGPGWSAYPKIADGLRDRLSAVEPDRLPSAGHVARLARSRFMAGERLSPADARPNYLRDKVATVN